MAGVKREAPSAPVAAEAASSPAVITNKILQNRLLAGLGNKGGARGSLTKCAFRLGDLSSSGFHQDKKDALLRELQHQKLEMTKLVLTLQRNRIELETVRTTTEDYKQQTVTETAAVQEQRRQLRQQCAVTKCEREYEALAEVAAARYPTSRRVLQQQLDDLTTESRDTKAKVLAAQAETTVRQGQFQLLMQCMLDLKQSLLHEDVVATAAEVGEEEGQEEEEEDAAMDVEAPQGKTPQEEDLYGDL
jgi:hypothetical protein